jgi:hypothetical protein
VPWRRKYALLIGHTRRAPIVEIRFTGLPDSLTKGMKQIIQHLGLWVIANKVIIATVDLQNNGSKQDSL